MWHRSTLGLVVVGQLQPMNTSVAAAKAAKEELADTKKTSGQRRNREDRQEPMPEVKKENIEF